MISDDKIKLDDIETKKQVKTVSIEPVQDLHGYESPWISTDVDKQPYLFRTINDSSVQDKGTHEIDKLVGGTVAWNQLYNKPNGTVISNGLTFTISNGRISVSGVNNGSGASYCTFNFINQPPANHVILFGGIPGTGSATTYDITLTNTAGNTPAFTGWLIVKKSGEYQMLNIDVRLNYDADTKPLVFVPQVFDLTQMFGSTIADYIYSLEQTTAGAGVAWFRKLFPAPYYPYNAGTLMSVKTSAHVTRGFNQWDEEWIAASSSVIQSKNFNPCLPNTTYYLALQNHSGSRYWCAVVFYDADKTQIGGNNWCANTTVTSPENAAFFKIHTNDGGYVYGNTYNHDICINISKTTGTPKNGDYVAYDGHTYALDADLELRGIPKLDSNNKLYYDGDIYEASGNVQRRYGIVDLGALNWAASTTSETRDIFRANISDIRTLAVNYEVPKLITSKFVSVTIGKSWTPGDISMSGVNVASVSCVVNHSEYSNAASFKTAISGAYLIYELATPTTETADPYTSTQVINLDGTEEYVDTRTVPIPVGHESNYANICPISGWTGANVTRTGKNLFDKSNVTNGGFYADGTVNPNSNDSRVYTDFIRIEPNTTYYISNGIALISGRAGFWYDDNENPISQISFFGSSTYEGAVTSPANAKYARIATEGTRVDTCQFEIGSTATEYEAYDGQSVTIQLGQTVYGGTLDVTTGLLTVDRATVTFDANLSTGNFGVNALPNATQIAWTAYPSIGIAKDVFVCDTLTYKSIDTNAPLTICGAVNVPRMFLYLPTSVTNKTEAVEWFADHPTTVVYHIATPQTYQLSPTQIILLAETDNVWADCGDITLQSCFINNAANVTGIVAIEHGGTGATTAADARANLDITPVNIGAVAKSGGTMTGVLNTNSDIIQTAGYIKGENGSSTNHALKLGHNSDDHMKFFEYGGVFTFYQSRGGTDTAIFQIKNGLSDTPLPVNNGGTGATTAVDARANLEVPSLTGSGASGTWGINVTGSAQTVKGTYTSSGGQQNPNYFGTNKVGFLMMNTTVNSNGHYKDWLIMDCYSGSDVGGSVAFGVNRQALGAYIMRSEAARSSWAESAELLGTHNYTSYCPTKTGGGASGTWGIDINGNAGSATYASSYLASRGTVSGSSHAEALKAYFNSYKASEPRNALIAHYSSAYDNGSLCMGYFLNSHDSNPYGGFFVANYDTPYYVGISNGSYTQQTIYTSNTTIPISNGGTGATTGAQALINMGASIYLTSSDYSTLYNTLKTLELNYPVCIRLNNDAIRKLSGKDDISGGYGTVVKTGLENGGAIVLSFDICLIAGNYRYSFVTRITSAELITSSVYRYSGTQLVN